MITFTDSLEVDFMCIQVETENLFKWSNTFWWEHNQQITEQCLNYCGCNKVT